uniref:Uncharacterized protein n=1 Tax=Anguilla anguilla TaxID=7936 RepID=A0A0E9S1D5_ANGAN
MFKGIYSSLKPYIL